MLMVNEKKEHSPLTEEDECQYNAKLLVLMISEFDDRCIKDGYMDRQWYIEWKDALNKMSIDPDRPDTKK